jgi:hypothetical protein
MFPPLENRMGRIKPNIMWKGKLADLYGRNGAQGDPPRAGYFKPVRKCNCGRERDGTLFNEFRGTFAPHVVRVATKSIGATACADDSAVLSTWSS